MTLVQVALMLLIACAAALKSQRLYLKTVTPPMSEALLSVGPSLMPVNLRDHGRGCATAKSIVRLCQTSDDNADSDSLFECSSTAPTSTSIRHDALDAIPRDCRLVPGESGVSDDNSTSAFERLTRWNATKHQFLPDGHARLESDRQEMWLYFSVLPFGQSFVLLGVDAATMVCPVSIQDSDGAVQVLSARITIRSSLPEVALVTTNMQFMATFRGGSQQADADVSELDMNRVGLHIRIAVSSDMFVTAAGAAHIQKSSLLERDYQTCEGESESAGAGGCSTPNTRLATSSQEMLERRATRVKQLLVDALSCSPLPCLSPNPFYNVSHLHPPAAGEEAVDPDVLRGHRRSLSDHTARRILHGDSTSHQLPSSLRDLVDRWKEYGALHPLLRVQDVTLSDNVADIVVSADELRRRGFLLPRFEHVCSWWQRSVVGTASPTPSCQDLPGWQRLSREWKALLEKDSRPVQTFHLDFKFPCGITVKTAGETEADISANCRKAYPFHYLDAEQMKRFPNMGRTVVHSLPYSKLGPRGAIGNDPYPSVVYEVTHPDGRSQEWAKMNGVDFVPLTWSCVRGTNRSKQCPLRFGVVAPYLRDGFEHISLFDKSEDELRLRHETVLLLCPPQEEFEGAARCGASYYHEYESSFAAFFTNAWVAAVRKDETYNRLLNFDVSVVPSDVALEAFRKPVYVGIRLPAGVTQDDYQVPRPGVSQREGVLYGFVITEDATSPVMHAGDEL